MLASSIRMMWGGVLLEQGTDGCGDDVGFVACRDDDDDAAQRDVCGDGCFGDTPEPAVEEDEINPDE